ncbi:hypothetical protein GWE18_00170 [Bradyrhizobium sp. CSA112]|uniref:hypothetical protein n=1 Tax=Bradyrhizobium sp. CSA112 TaxID=2699170 RepID=UPI0023B1E760|nr:hypothetical protein [Bradyrhizobium sp. CSA112]MDE5451291.1 hypothetical protein [Bradyrhizobium sp. CSA112]
MSVTELEEIASFTLALEEVAAENSGIGPNGLRFMCREAARTIRKLRPDLAFTEGSTGGVGREQQP